MGFKGRKKGLPYLYSWHDHNKRINGQPVHAQGHHQPGTWHWVRRQKRVKWVAKCLWCGALLDDSTRFQWCAKSPMARAIEEAGPDAKVERLRCR